MPGTADVNQMLSVLVELTVAIRGRHMWKQTKKKGVVFSCCCCCFFFSTIRLQRRERSFLPEEIKNGVKKGIVGKVDRS